MSSFWEKRVTNLYSNKGKLDLIRDGTRIRGDMHNADMDIPHLQIWIWSQCLQNVKVIGHVRSEMQKENDIYTSKTASE